MPPTRSAPSKRTSLSPLRRHDHHTSFCHTATHEVSVPAHHLAGRCSIVFHSLDVAAWHDEEEMLRLEALGWLQLTESADSLPELTRVIHLRHHYIPGKHCDLLNNRARAYPMPVAPDDILKATEMTHWFIRKRRAVIPPFCGRSNYRNGVLSGSHWRSTKVLVVCSHDATAQVNGVQEQKRRR